MSKTYKLKEWTTRDVEVHITEEEIKRLAIEAGIIEPEKVKPFGYLYKYKSGSLVMHINEDLAFGFEIRGDSVDGFYNSGWFNLKSDDWQPATEADYKRWEELLLEKARSMGYENGNYKCLDTPSFTEKVSNEFFLCGRGSVWMGVDDGNECNMVFDSETGEWAEVIIPELTHSQIEEKIGKFKYIGVK